jgi:hypothetical protein
MKNLENAQAAVVTIWANSEPDINIFNNAGTAVSIATGPDDDRNIYIKQVEMNTDGGLLFDAFRVERRYSDGETQKVSLVAFFPSTANALSRREILVALIRAISNEWPKAEKKEAEGE